MKIRRTKVTVVTEHVFTFAEQRPAVLVKCEKCGAAARIMRFDEVSARAGLSLQAFCSELEANGFHFTAMPDGELCLCLTRSNQAESPLE